MEHQCIESPRAEPDLVEPAPRSRISRRSADLGASTQGVEAEPSVAEPGRRDAESAADLNAFREHALSRGVNPFLYWGLRAMLVPFFLVYFRLQRVGREHLPRTGRCCWPPTTAASSTRS